MKKQTSSTNRIWKPLTSASVSQVMWACTSHASHSSGLDYLYHFWPRIIPTSSLFWCITPYWRSASIWWLVTAENSVTVFRRVKISTFGTFFPTKVWISFARVGQMTFWITSSASELLREIFSHASDFFHVCSHYFLISHIGILLPHTNHHTLVAGTFNNGGKGSTGSIISRCTYF